jgi:WD40 repeat protein/beta-lactamase regulating signal transducer with metallopeptidase domain
MPAVPFDALASNLLVAVALAAVAFACGRWANRPALAHALWLLVLVKLATPPLFALPVRVLPADPPPAMPVLPATTTTVIPEIAIAAATPSASVPVPMPETIVEPIPLPPASITWSTIVLSVWFAGAAIWLMLTALHVRRFNRYLRFAEDAPESFVREVAAVASRMNIAVPRVKFLPGEIAPFIWSFGRTTLYFPENLRDRLSTEQRATVIAHELAHIWRRDHLVRWIELIAVAAFWWLPLAWYARRELRRLEEDCCDAVVVANFPDSNGTYASAILDTIDFLAGSRPMPRMASAIGDVSSLHRRLTRIIDGAPPRLLSRPLRFALFLGAVALLATAPRLAQATAAALAIESPRFVSDAPHRESDATEAVQYLATPIRLMLPDVRGRFAAAALSPDGSRVALANDAEVLVWDLRERRIAFRYRGHSATVNAVVFSPDGRSIASAGNDAVVRVWSAIDGADVRLFDGHANWIFALAYSPDGLELASAGYDRHIRIWNLKSGSSVRTLNGHAAAVRAIAYSPTGRHLASAGGDGRLAIWDAESGASIRSIAVFRGAVRAIAFSPDGTRIAAGGDDRAVRFWNLADGVPSAPIALADAVTALRFTPGGTVLLAGQFGGQIANIRPQTGTVRGSVGPTRPVHTDAIAALLTASNGHALLSVSHDGTIFAWPSAGLPETARRASYDHAHPVTCTATSPDGRWIATGAADGTVRIWNCEAALEHRRIAAHVGGTIAMAFLGNSRLLTVGRDENVRIWDMSNGQVVRHLALPSADVRIALSPDARQLAVVGPKIAGAMVWDVETGRVAQRFGARLGGFTAVAFAPDERRLYVGSTAGDLIAFDRATGKEASRADVSNEAGIERIAFSRLGERVALVLKHRDDAERAGAHEIVIWNGNARTVEEWSRPLLTDGPVAAIAFHRDASILTAGHDGFLVEWDAATGRRLRSIHAHLEAVQGLQVLAGNTVVSAGDQLAKLWDWPQETRP